MRFFSTVVIAVTLLSSGLANATGKESEYCDDYSPSSIEKMEKDEKGKLEKTSVAHSQSKPLANEQKTRESTLKDFQKVRKRLCSDIQDTRKDLEKSLADSAKINAGAGQCDIFLVQEGNLKKAKTKLNSLEEKLVKKSREMKDIDEQASRGNEKSILEAVRSDNGTLKDLGPELNNFWESRAKGSLLSPLVTGPANEAQKVRKSAEAIDTQSAALMKRWQDCKSTSK